MAQGSNRARAVAIALRRRRPEPQPWWVWALLALAMMLAAMASNPVRAQTSVPPAGTAPAQSPNPSVQASPVPGAPTASGVMPVIPPPAAGAMPVIPPPVSGTMPVIPPPGSAGGSTAVVPK